LTRASCSTAIRSARVVVVSRSHNFISSATWSFRLRPVCNFLPASPIRSISAASTTMWMSSYRLSNVNRPASISAAISVSPRLICRRSSALISFCARSISACAILPAISYLASRASTLIDSTKSVANASCGCFSRLCQFLSALPINPPPSRYSCPEPLYSPIVPIILGLPASPVNVTAPQSILTGVSSSFLPLLPLPFPASCLPPCGSVCYPTAVILSLFFTSA